MSPRQRRFVQEYAVDGNAAAAARRAGYSPRSARVNGPRLLSNAAVREALRVSQAETQRMLQMDRQAVVAGLLKAVNLARDQANPAAMVAALREIIRIGGYGSPDRAEGTPNEAVANLSERMEAMSDAELFMLLEDNGSA